jgi:hypothetical protein
VLRRRFGFKRKKFKRNAENYMSGSRDCTFQEILLYFSNGGRSCVGSEISYVADESGVETSVETESKSKSGMPSRKREGNIASQFKKKKSGYGKERHDHLIEGISCGRLWVKITECSSSIKTCKIWSS